MEFVDEVKKILTLVGGIEAKLARFGDYGDGGYVIVDDLRKSDIPNWCAWLLFAWDIFHIIVEIVLEVHYCCTFYRLEGSELKKIHLNNFTLFKNNYSKKITMNTIMIM
jgi:hypothetical protein